MRGRLFQPGVARRHLLVRKATILARNPAPGLFFDVFAFRNQNQSFQIPKRRKPVFADGGWAIASAIMRMPFTI